MKKSQRTIKRQLGRYQGAAEESLDRLENVVSMERNGDERTLKSSASVKTAVAERIQWVSSQKQSFHPIKRTGSPHSYQLKSSAFIRIRRG